MTRRAKDTTRQLARNLGFEVFRVRKPKPKPGQNILHFLHLRKNAGSQIRRLAPLITKEKPDTRIILHPHRVLLHHLPADVPYFFSIREPVSRFKSGFYGRKTKNAPGAFKEWTAHEQAAFARFAHANDLAEALSPDHPLAQDAMAAVMSLRHTARDQIDWFVECGDIFELQPPLHIVRQGHFDHDFGVLTRKLGITADIQSFQDDRRRHKTRYDDAPPLSELAVRNLQAWFAKDVLFYARCEAWLAQNEVT